MVNVLVIAILIIPWLILPFNNVPDNTRIIKAVFFDLTMLGIIVMALKDGLKFEFKNKYLAWLAAWVFITFIFNWYYPILRGIGYNVGTLDPMIHFTLAVMATMLVCSNLERVDFIRCGKAICISCTFVSIFCIFQGIGLDPMKYIVKYDWKESRHIAALLDNPDVAGNYICMCLPLFIYFNKPKYYICLGLSIIALLFTQSSISIGAGFIAVFIYLIFRFSKVKKVVFALLFIQILFVLFCLTNSHFNKIHGGFTGRVEAWQMMIQRQNNPLFGMGLGAVKSLNVVTGQCDTPACNESVREGKFVDNHWMFAHNDYLMIWVELGALGLFLLILVIIHAFKRFNYKEDNQIGFAYFGCFTSFLIIMFGSFPMEMPPIALNGLVFFWAVSKI